MKLKAVHFTEDKCPPRPIFGTKPYLTTHDIREFDSSCAVGGIDDTSDICADNPCSESSDCFALSESQFHCVCQPGYKKNENGICEKIIEINECEIENDCSVNANCIDSLHSQGTTP